MDELCKVCEGLCCGEIPRLNAELQRLRSLDLDYMAKVLAVAENMVSSLDALTTLVRNTHSALQRSSTGE